MRFARLVIALGSVATLLYACTGEDLAQVTTAPQDDAGSDATTETPAGAPSIKLHEPTALVMLKANETIKVPVEIDRINAFKGPVKLVVQPLPDGVAVPPLTLEGDATKGEITVTTLATAPASVNSVQLVATAEPSLSDTKPFSLVVRGAPGTRDTTFGEKDGATEIAGVTPRAIARTADDGLLIVSDTNVARVLPTGKIDTAFGKNGIATLKTGGQQKIIHVLKDGKILVAGRNAGSSSTHAVVQRLLPNGAPDTSYGTDGVAQVPFPAQSVYFFGADVDETGRLVMGIPTNSGGTIYKRVHENGSTDATYGQNLGAGAAGWQLLRLRGETPIVFGTHYVTSPQPNNYPAISVVSSSSSPVIDQTGVSYDNTLTVYSALIDKQGRLVFAGEGVWKGSGTPETISGQGFLLRADKDGKPDTNFATIYEEVNPGTYQEYTTFKSALEDENGKLLVVAEYLKLSGQTVLARQPILYRYDDKGARDLGFGNKGFVKDTFQNVDFNHVNSGVLQTKLPTVVIAASNDVSSTVLVRYWR
jgi:uncharacterized delta-60 repeat protein